MNIERAVIWKRLDVPGMDACQFPSVPEGWEISGAAIFVAEGRPARLSYEVACHSDWSARRARVSGWLGKKNICLELERPGTEDWIVNGVAKRGTAFADIDLGFTPATNTNAIRRLDLLVGQEAETTSLWLDDSDWELKPLRQIYRRKSDRVLAYASPLHDFRADIEVDELGVVVNYPGLWSRCPG